MFGHKNNSTIHGKSITSKTTKTNLNAILFTRYMISNFRDSVLLYIEVPVGNDQEMARSERNFHFTGKN